MRSASKPALVRSVGWLGRIAGPVARNVVL